MYIHTYNSYIYKYIYPIHCIIAKSRGARDINFALPKFCVSLFTDLESLVVPLEGVINFNLFCLSFQGTVKVSSTLMPY